MRGAKLRAIRKKAENVRGIRVLMAGINDITIRGGRHLDARLVAEFRRELSIALEMEEVVVTPFYPPASLSGRDYEQVAEINKVIEDGNTSNGYVSPSINDRIFYFENGRWRLNVHKLWDGVHPNHGLSLHFKYTLKEWMNNPYVPTTSGTQEEFTTSARQRVDELKQKQEKLVIELKKAEIEARYEERSRLARERYEVELAECEKERKESLQQLEREEKEREESGEEGASTSKDQRTEVGSNKEDAEGRNDQPTAVAEILIDAPEPLTYPDTEDFKYRDIRGNEVPRVRRVC